MHNTVLDFIQRQEFPVGSTGISFIRIGEFDLIFCMSTVNRRIRQTYGIIVRSRAQCCRKNKAVYGINGSMFLNAVMQFIVFNGPVGIEISGIFFRQVNKLCSRGGISR